MKENKKKEEVKKNFRETKYSDCVYPFFLKKKMTRKRDFPK